MDTTTDASSGDRDDNPTVTLKLDVPLALYQRCEFLADLHRTSIEKNVLVLLSKAVAAELLARRLMNPPTPM